MPSSTYDCIIVGAGPAGLSAALILGRCRRRVLVCDAGRPRNAVSSALHGFFTRDGSHPMEMLRLGREQLRPYDSVELLDIAAAHAEQWENGFLVRLNDGREVTTKKLLLATGVVDELPPLKNFEQFYGRTAWHCPYCDGWEMRDQPLAIYGRGALGKALALEMILWSRDLVLCSDGPAELEPAERAALERQEIAIREEPIDRLEGVDGQLERIVFVNGDALPRRGLFFSTPAYQSCDLAEKLGCDFTSKRAVRTGKNESTPIPGLYVAGDASRAVQLAIIAAAEGAQAAFAINTDLLQEELA